MKFHQFFLSNSTKITQNHIKSSKSMQIHQNQPKSYVHASKSPAQAQEQEQCIVTYARFARVTCLTP